MTHKQTKEICGSWNPTVSNLTGAGTVKIERAKWLQDYEGIIHFEVFFTYAPPRSVDVESVDFVLTFPTEFHHKGSLYGWFDCGKGVLLALNPDAPFLEATVKTTFDTASARRKVGKILGVFIYFTH